MNNTGKKRRPALRLLAALGALLAIVVAVSGWTTAAASLALLCLAVWLSIAA